MKSSLIYPCRKLMSKILEISPPQILNQRATLVYENQVPNIAVLLVRGVAKLVSCAQKDQLIIHKPCIFCLNQLLEKRESVADLILDRGAEISFLDNRGVEELSKFVCLDEVGSAYVGS